MVRYKKYDFIIKNYQLSKFNIYSKNNILNIENIEIQAGHFKPNSLFVEHGLLLFNMTGLLPKIILFKHGKRLKNTILLTTLANKSVKWLIFDNFLNSFLPLISDIKLFNLKRQQKESLYYSWRIRTFFEWEDSTVLLSERIIKKSIFLPLFFNIRFKKNNLITYYNYNIEQVVRMYKLPVKFFK